MRETGRENAFSAHAIFGAPSMVEAFEDLRVAETPFVTEPPHVRFSAGHPLRALNGEGCRYPVDHRPRSLASADLQVVRAFRSSWISCRWN
jgi:hypothetical protein